MPRMPLDLVKPGMVLDEDIYSLQGEKLFERGLGIEDQHIKHMKTSGILEVLVHTVKYDLAGEDPLWLNRYRTWDYSSALEKIFDAMHKWPQNSFLKTLELSVKDYLSQQEELS